MARAGAVAVALATLVVLTPACAYYNAIYNASSLYEEAERERQAGRDSVAVDLYADVVRKAAQGYRRDPAGSWAHEALLLVGKARLRLGDLVSARAALAESVRRAESPAERRAALAYLGIARARAGDRSEAMAHLNEALVGSLLENTLSPETRSEAHLHRGRVLLEVGRPDEGWWDLDRAAEVEEGIRVEAGLDRLAWAIALDEPERALESVQRLLAYPEAGLRGDSVVGLLRIAGEGWGPSWSAAVLDSLGTSTWSRPARGRMGLERARFLREAGDTLEAIRVAEEVASGLGGAAEAARLELAGWGIAGAEDFGDLYGVRAVLLPASADPTVQTLLEAIDRLDALALSGVEDPLAWFMAGEVARDAVGARRLARQLFIAYEGAVPGAPWASKALLAALDLTETEAEREMLRARLEDHRSSPYVLAARGEPAAGFEALEEELALRMREVETP